MVDVSPHRLQHALILLLYYHKLVSPELWTVENKSYSRCQQSHFCSTQVRNLSLAMLPGQLTLNGLWIST